VTVLSGTAAFKQIDLRFDWLDATGGSRSLRLTSAISPLTLSHSPLDDLSAPSTGSYRPIVRRPTPVTEGMIPLALGTNSTDDQTAATNPKPELVGRNDDTLVSDTRFDLLTFNTSDNLGQNGFVRFDKRIETAMVGCTCKTGLTGFPTGGSSPAINSLLKAKAFLPSYWDGTRYTEPEDAGTPTRSPDDSVSQSQLCDVCCRDHADPSTGPKFNPWVTGQHPHYDAAGVVVTSGTFKEACRVIRVNGVWRVTPDPRSEDIALLPTRVYPSTTGSTVAPADNNAATSPLVADAGKTSYIAFAYDFIKQFFYDKTTLSDSARATMQTTAGLNNPEYVPIKAGDTRWLHARTILSDKLEQPAIDRIQKAIDACTATTTIGRAQCVLPYVPMATINVTELAVWSGKAVSETGIVPTGTLATSIVNYGQALLNRYVSALALVGPISPTDDDNPIKDEQPFALATGTRTGAWLSVASPASVLFGNPANPSRGFASLTGGTSFNIELDRLPNASDRDPNNDPSVNVGIVSPQPCNPQDPTIGGNPFPCTTDATTGVVVAVGKFNYLRKVNGNINDPCNTDNNDKIGEGQAECPAFTLSGSTYVSGTVGTATEVRSVTLPTVTAGSTYRLTFSAVNPTANATAVCSAGQWTGWTCP
jgi:hypothetical protein